MKILIVANYNPGKFSIFVIEQTNTIKRQGVEVDFFGVQGKGILGYLSNLGALKKKIREYQPDIVHAHYGLCGLLANLQRKVPVVTTFHGSDIHALKSNLFFSRIAIRLSAYNIFVSKSLLKLSGYKGTKQAVIACGVDINLFHPIERLKARELLGWDIDAKYVLFAGAFDNEVKNYPLAKDAVALMKDVKLVELKGFTHEQVNLAMNAADCLLVTSFREGSPLVVKEAMACNTPIVSVIVGDVVETTQGSEGSYLSTHNANQLAECLRQALAFKGKTNGRQFVIERQLSTECIAKRIVNIYKQIAK